MEKLIVGTGIVLVLFELGLELAIRSDGFIIDGPRKGFWLLLPMVIVAFLGFLTLAIIVHKRRYVSWKSSFYDSQSMDNDASFYDSQSMDNDATSTSTPPHVASITAGQPKSAVVYALTAQKLNQICIDQWDPARLRQEILKIEELKLLAADLIHVIADYAMESPQPLFVHRECVEGPRPRESIEAGRLRAVFTGSLHSGLTQFKVMAINSGTSSADTHKEAMCIEGPDVIDRYQWLRETVTVGDCQYLFCLQENESRRTCLVIHRLPKSGNSTYYHALRVYAPFSAWGCGNVFWSHGMLLISICPVEIFTSDLVNQWILTGSYMEQQPSRLQHASSAKDVNSSSVHPTASTTDSEQVEYMDAKWRVQWKIEINEPTPYQRRWIVSCANNLWMMTGAGLYMINTETGESRISRQWWHGIEKFTTPVRILADRFIVVQRLTSAYRYLDPGCEHFRHWVFDTLLRQWYGMARYPDTSMQFSHHGTCLQVVFAKSGNEERLLFLCHVYDKLTRTVYFTPARIETISRVRPHENEYTESKVVGSSCGPSTTPLEFPSDPHLYNPTHEILGGWTPSTFYNRGLPLTSLRKPTLLP